MPIIGGYSLEHHVEGESRWLDAPALRLELAKELADLQQDEAWRSTGHSAKTLVKYSDLRVVLIALKPGACLSEHRTLGQISLQTLQGRVRVKVANEVVDLPAGALLALAASVPHDVEAVEQSALLLTISLPAPTESGTTTR